MSITTTAITAIRMASATIQAAPMIPPVRKARAWS